MLKKILFVFIILFFSLPKLAKAVCEQNCSCPNGECNVMVQCQTIGAFNTSSIFQEEIDGCIGTWVMTCNSITINPDDIDPYDVTNFTPENYTDLVCSYECVYDGNDYGTEACIMEDAQFWCGCPDDGSWTPTPTPTDDPGSTPTPTPDVRYIKGNFYEYTNAGFVGNTCGGQATQTPVDISSTNIYAHISGTNIQTGGIDANDASKYTINMTTSPTGQTWDITLSLDNGSLIDSEKLACGCPAAIDPEDPFTCQYSGISDNVSDVDFYLKPYLDSSSWFQTFGGNIFARSNIQSFLPIANCVNDGTCEDSLIAKTPETTNQLSSGFALTSGTTNNIITHNGIFNLRSYINSSDRTDNLNAYATSVKVNTYGYDFYSKQLAGDIDIIRPAGSADLNEIRTDDAWLPNETNIIEIQGDLTIDETSNWDVPSGETVVVLVNGDLNVSDSLPDSELDQVISVEEGGFLAFFAANNITFDESIGYAIDPASPTIPAVTNANANVVGVFVADNILTIDGFEATDVPDRKFIGSGNFVGWTNVALNRDFDDGDQGATLSSMQAVENFIFRPDFMINFPDELKVINSNWRELTPQYLEQ